MYQYFCLKFRVTVVFLISFWLTSNAHALEVMDVQAETDTSVVKAFVSISSEAKYLQVHVISKDFKSLSTRNFYTPKETGFVEADIVLPFGKGEYQLSFLEWHCKDIKGSCSSPVPLVHKDVTNHAESLAPISQITGLNGIQFDASRIKEGVIRVHGEVPSVANFLEVAVIPVGSSGKSEWYNLKAKDGYVDSELSVPNEGVYKLQYSLIFCNRPNTDCGIKKEFLNFFWFKVGDTEKAYELSMNEFMWSQSIENDSEVSISGPWNNFDFGLIWVIKDGRKFAETFLLKPQENLDEVSFILPYGAGDYRVYIGEANCKNSFDKDCKEKAPYASYLPIRVNSESAPVKGFVFNGINVSSYNTTNGIIRIWGTNPKLRDKAQWLKVIINSKGQPVKVGYLKIQDDGHFDGEIFLGENMGTYKIFVEGRSCKSIYHDCDGEGLGQLANFYVRNQALTGPTETPLTINGLTFDRIHSDEGFFRVTGKVPKGSLGANIHLTAIGQKVGKSWQAMATDGEIDEVVYFRDGVGPYEVRVFNIECNNFRNSNCYYNTNDLAFLELKNKKEMNLDLTPSSKVQSNHPEIVNLAKSLTQNIESDFEKSKAIFTWVAKNINRDSQYFDLKDADALLAHDSRHNAIHTLQTGRAVCAGYSYLTVALHRAVGIPAQTITVDTKTRADSHMVVKVNMGERWIYMDSFWGAGHTNTTRNEWVPDFDLEEFDIPMDRLIKRRFNLEYTNY